jgi:hypothetical protein
MPKMTLIVLLALMIVGVAEAQQKEIRQAQPGESCLTKYNDCGDWCTKNRSAGSEKFSCDSECTRYRGNCQRTGVWSTALGKVETRNLPEK